MAGLPTLAPSYAQVVVCSGRRRGVLETSGELARGPFIRAGRACAPGVAAACVLGCGYFRQIQAHITHTSQIAGWARGRGHRLVRAGGTVRLSALPPPPHVPHRRDPWHRPRGRGTSREPLRPAHTATATQAAVLGCTQTSAVREGVEGRLLGPSGPGSRGVPGTRLHAACGVSRHLVSSEQMSFCTMSTGQARPVDGRSIVAAIASSANEKSRSGEQNHACAAATWRGGEKEWSKSRQSVQGGAGRC